MDMILPKTFDEDFVKSIGKSIFSTANSLMFKQINEKTIGDSDESAHDQIKNKYSKDEMHTIGNILPSIEKLLIESTEYLSTLVGIEEDLIAINKEKAEREKNAESLAKKPKNTDTKTVTSDSNNIGVQPESNAFKAALLGAGAMAALSEAFTLAFSLPKFLLGTMLLPFITEVVEEVTDGLVSATPLAVSGAFAALGGKGPIALLGKTVANTAAAVKNSGSYFTQPMKRLGGLFDRLTGFGGRVNSLLIPFRTPFKESGAIMKTVKTLLWPVGVIASITGGVGKLLTPGLKTLFGGVGSVIGKAGGLLGKIFWPITVIGALWNAVTAFQTKGGSFAQKSEAAFQSAVDDIINKPANFLKDLVGYGLMQFPLTKDIGKWLLGQDVDLIGFVTAIPDFFRGLIENIKGIFGWGNNLDKRLKLEKAIAEKQLLIDQAPEGSMNKIVFEKQLAALKKELLALDNKIATEPTEKEKEDYINLEKMKDALDRSVEQTNKREQQIERLIKENKRNEDDPNIVKARIEIEEKRKANAELLQKINIEQRRLLSKLEIEQRKHATIIKYPPIIPLPPKTEETNDKTNSDNNSNSNIQSTPVDDTVVTATTTFLDKRLGKESPVLAVQSQISDVAVQASTLNASASEAASTAQSVVLVEGQKVDSGTTIINNNSITNNDNKTVNTKAALNASYSKRFGGN